MQTAPTVTVVPRAVLDDVKRLQADRDELLAALAALVRACPRMTATESGRYPAYVAAFNSAQQTLARIKC